MLKIIIPEKHETAVRYDLVFDDGRCNGFGFPCDADGKLLESEEQNPAARASYQECLKHPERFVRFNKVVKTEMTVKQSPRGICDCGEEVTLFDLLYGACQCLGCWRRYNLFGQELLPPEQWEGGC